MARILVILFLAMGLGACASNATEGADGAAAASEKPKQRCYREKSTGSRLGTRVCVPAGD